MNILEYIKKLSDNEKIQKLLMLTLGKILLNQININELINENEDKIIHIRDWISSVIQNNEEWKTPRVLTIDALNNTADKYFEKKNNKVKTIELNEKHEKLISDLDDYYIIQMLTPESLDNESRIMQHCIGHGGYDHKLNSENYQYLSLRDKYNKAHVTLEVYKNKILQLQGKQNKIPEQKYLEKLLPWLMNNNCKIDLNKYGFIFNENDKKFYSIYNMPDNCKIDGDCDLFNCEQIVNIPKNFTVNGYLNLSKSKNLAIIEDGLVVNKSLYLSETNIKTLSNNIIIKEDLYLIESKIEKLPDNLDINGELNLNKSKNILELPKGLKVKRLVICETNIKNLPKDIKIKDELVLLDSKIEKLPDNLNVKNIYIDSSHINIINNTMKFENIIIDYVAYSAIDFYNRYNINI